MTVANSTLLLQDLPFPNHRSHFDILADDGSERKIVSEGRINSLERQKPEK